MKYLGVMICLFFFHSTYSFAEDSVRWMSLNWPPWMIIEGKDQGTGRFDYLQKIVIENLPKYRHQKEVMNWSRFWNEVEEGKNVCYVFGLKTGKRDDLVYFSAPISMVLPNAIVMRKEDAVKLGNPNSYSLVQLLKDKKMRGVVEKTRSFTEDLDILLKEHEPGSNLQRIVGEPASLVKMVISGRADYTLEYPIVAAYEGKKEIGNSDAITTIPIAEVAPFSYVYLACTKNEWGKKVVDRWNTALHRLKPTKEYREICEIGLTGEKELRVIRSNYDGFIGAN